MDRQKLLPLENIARTSEVRRALTTLRSQVTNHSSWDLQRFVLFEYAIVKWQRLTIGEERAHSPSHRGINASKVAMYGLNPIAKTSRWHLAMIFNPLMCRQLRDDALTSHTFRLSSRAWTYKMPRLYETTSGTKRTLLPTTSCLQGKGWTGGTTCDAGSYCQAQDKTTGVPGTASGTTTSGAATPTSTALRGLHALAKSKGRYFGTATDQLWNINDAAYLSLTGNPSEFGMNTPGNQLKWDATERSRGSFTYTYADYEVSWAKNHSQAIRGHTLGGFNIKILAQPTPIVGLQRGIQQCDPDLDYAEPYLECYGTVGNRDVVNEMFNDDGTWRSSVFYNTIGPSFVAVALRAARATDAKAKLYLNEYNTDWVGAKSNAMYNLAKDLVGQGVPLDGIGFHPEAHLVVNSFERSFQTNYQRFADLKLDVAITELDIRMTLPATSALLTAQAENYKYVMNSCLAVSRCVGVTTWDTSDDVSPNRSLAKLGRLERLMRWVESIRGSLVHSLVQVTLYFSTATRNPSRHITQSLMRWLLRPFRHSPESFIPAVPRCRRGRMHVAMGHPTIVVCHRPALPPGCGTGSGMPIFGCFALSALCGPTNAQLDISHAHVSGAFKAPRKARTPDEEFFVTFGWPAGLPFEVHQHQIEHIRSCAVELYDVTLRELGGAVDWRSELGVSIDSIKLHVYFFLCNGSKFINGFINLGTLIKSAGSPRTGPREVTEQHTHLYGFGKDFQVRWLCVIVQEDVYERARALDLAALEVTLGIICKTPEDLDVLKREDKLLVQWFMQHLQRKIATTPGHLTEPYLSAMLGIHRRTRYLPPLSDLAHEISKRDTFPFMRGGQSDIWRGTWLGLPVALKLVRTITRRSGATVRGISLDPESKDDQDDNDTVCPGGDAVRAFKREAEIWRQLMHDNVHPFLGVWVNMDDVYLVSPFMERGDAAEWVRNRNDVDRLKLVSPPKCPLRQKPSVCADLPAAVMVLLGRWVCVRRTLATAAIGQCVLEGLTLTPVSQQLGVAGATRWMARELLLPTPLPALPDSDSSSRVEEAESDATVTRETDIWSWGMTALEAMTAQPPYSHRRRDTQVMLDIIGGVLPTRPRTGFLSEPKGDALWALMERCWKADPRERPSSSEIVAEMWKLQGRG
ncbi:glycosyl hydrolase family 10 domain-containing protein [Rhizoctonia solani AG-1 IA]|uniref:endo-1,4-beta-xylanase n=1 Tax=Thanatephorus cucumeris (strain AG1-IA) TaxID=983506 RepID=L8WU82_THACA|nr:glycosyl hydrolase family 10 domain-containing protein [Rhizoctonia solani AG-1 IA]